MLWIPAKCFGWNETQRNDLHFSTIALFSGLSCVYICWIRLGDYLLLHCFRKIWSETCLRSCDWCKVQKQNAANAAKAAHPSHARPRMLGSVACRMRQSAWQKASALRVVCFSLRFVREFLLPFPAFSTHVTHLETNYWRQTKCFVMVPICRFS